MLDSHLAAFDGPFEWGFRDCALFAADWVGKVTGRQTIPAGIVWHDEKTAADAIATMGFENMVQLATSVLGKPVPVSSARLGDIVGRAFKDGRALGICTGSDAAFIDRVHGLVRLSLLKCSHCWKVD